MHWVAFLRTHGQRPAHWYHVLFPSYWRQVNRERTAQVRSAHTTIPCGDVITTQFVHPSSQEVVRQDITIKVSRKVLQGVK